MAYATLVRAPRRLRQDRPVLSKDARMIREFRLSSTMGDTAIPQRPDLSPMAFLVGLLASSSIPLVILFWI